MTSKRLLYVCLDGLGDDPIPEFDGRTPLEAAATPLLDELAGRGRLGLVHTVGKGIAPESDIAVFAILGYDPREDHPGRGVLEAIGSGMNLEAGDAAFRVNFATADGDRILDRRVGRDLPSEDAQALAEEVNAAVSLPGATAELRATVEHRGVLVLRSAQDSLSANVSNTDPAYEKQGTLGVALETFEDRVARSEPLADTEEAGRTADLLNRFTEASAAVLDGSSVNDRRRREGRLPANLILARDAGDHVPDIEPIAKRFGPSWGCFVEMPVERGIAMVLGMAEVPAPTTPGAAERYAAWAALAAEAIEGHDALYIHIKGPDVPAHDGKAEEKRRIIESIDRSFFGELLPSIDPAATLLAVTADHATSCVRKAHTDDPVPLIVGGPGVDPDGADAFGERAAADGSIGTIRGVEIVPALVALMKV
ncbi:MAG: 2,3-bisphosphoglycerate-independent phosphoglycerate mutase [Actinomycetota bacterium]